MPALSDPRRFAAVAQVVTVVEMPMQLGLAVLGDDTAEVLAPGTHGYSPGFAVWGWFIPVALLWIPRRVALDVRRASGPTGGSLLVEGW